MDARIGRLFFRCYRSQGPGFRVRLAWPNRYFEVWIGRFLAYVAVLHCKGCDCEECVFDREVFG